VLLDAAHAPGDRIGDDRSVELRCASVVSEFASPPSRSSMD
jgi:hypothetical protein